MEEYIMDLKCDINEISDGKLYEINDLAKLNCDDCKGCHACCQGMGNSVILDPLDVYRLLVNLNISIQELLFDKIELNVVEGIILPNIKMPGQSEKCAFLNNDGRCSIHAFRPGLCRIFPLGRYYEGHSFKYFLHVNGCKNKERSKIKVKKWIDTPDLKKNEQFIIDWHYYLKDVQSIIKNTQDDTLIKSINMFILNNFYIRPYDNDKDFYSQFDDRLIEAKKYINR